MSYTPIRFLFPSINNGYSMDCRIKLSYRNSEDHIWVKKFCDTVLNREDNKKILRNFQNKDITFLNQYHELIQELLEEKDFIKMFNDMYEFYIKSLMIIKKVININKIEANNISEFLDYEYYLSFISYFLIEEDSIIMNKIYEEFDSIETNNCGNLMKSFKEKLRNNLRKMTWDIYNDIASSIESKKDNYKNKDYEKVVYQRMLRVEEHYKKRNESYLCKYKND